jgi:hypothetical protein
MPSGVVVPARRWFVRGTSRDFADGGLYEASKGRVWASK